MSEEQKQAKAKELVTKARESALKGKRFSELAKTPAWKELVEKWVLLIDLQRDEKLATSLVDYSPNARIPYSGPDGKQAFMSGEHLLYLRQLDELKSQIYADIIEEVEFYTRQGQLAEETLRKCNEMVNIHKHIKEQNKGK